MVTACLSTLLILFAQKTQSINGNAPSPPLKLEDQGVTSAKQTLGKSTYRGKLCNRPKLSFIQNLHPWYGRLLLL